MHRMVFFVFIRKQLIFEKKNPSINLFVSPKSSHFISENGCSSHCGGCARFSRSSAPRLRLVMSNHSSSNHPVHEVPMLGAIIPSLNLHRKKADILGLNLSLNHSRCLYLVTRCWHIHFLLFFSFVKRPINILVDAVVAWKVVCLHPVGILRDKLMMLYADMSIFLCHKTRERWVFQSMCHRDACCCWLVCSVLPIQSYAYIKIRLFLKAIMNQRQERKVS